MLTRSHVLVCALFVFVPCLASAQNKQQNATVPGFAPETVTIRLSRFAFEPDHLRLRAGVPVRLRFVNESNRGHDFSAPAFFSASSYAPGSAPPPKGRIEVPGKRSAEILLVPQQPGTYEFECTHFLHSFFGMTGTLDVIGSLTKAAS